MRPSEGFEVWPNAISLTWMCSCNLRSAYRTRHHPTGTAASIVEVYHLGAHLNVNLPGIARQRRAIPLASKVTLNGAAPGDDRGIAFSLRFGLRDSGLSKDAAALRLPERAATGGG
jgi:hypothetical protein